MSLPLRRPFGHAPEGKSQEFATRARLHALRRLMERVLFSRSAFERPVTPEHRPLCRSLDIVRAALDDRS